MTGKADTKLELNRAHMLEMKKYTAQQMRYIVNRLMFPEETFAACAVSAGYAEAHASVRCAEINRKPYVRQMFAHSEQLRREEGHEGDRVSDMTVDDLIAWHTAMILNSKASYKEQQASAIELARLKGYHKKEGSGSGNAMNVMDEILAMKAKSKAQSALP